MVVLREITKENYEECLNLNIADSQKKFCFLNGAFAGTGMGLL